MQTESDAYHAAVDLITKFVGDGPIGYIPALVLSVKFDVKYHEEWYIGVVSSSRFLLCRR